MGAAVSLFVLLSLSVFVVRLASVALRLTGLDDKTARFQALSAFTGTGFTTAEAETIVNYPLRRRIVSILMIVGNLGLVSLLATLVVSFVDAAGETRAVLRQLVWLLAGLVLLWFAMLNPAADRAMCRIIGKLLLSVTFLGRRGFTRLIQVGDGHSVCEHPVTGRSPESGSAVFDENMDRLGLKILAVRSPDGRTRTHAGGDAALKPGDSLIVYGADSGHEALERLMQ